MAQGVSGQQYELTPVPGASSCRSVRPSAQLRRFGGLHRDHRFHILDHTEHEEIAHVWLIEEAWSKKYNLPDEIDRLAMKSLKRNAATTGPGWG